MSPCRFTADPDKASGQFGRPPGYIVTLPSKEEILANPHICYYPPGY